MTPELLTETEIIKFLLTGFVGGILCTGIFWWSHVDDLKQIINHKERALKVKKPKITVHCHPDGFVRFE